MLPYFFRHYDPWVDQYFILDNHSTDDSQAMLSAHPKVTWRTFDVTGDSFVKASEDFYNTAWKDSRGKADWVVLVNVDEHLEHRDMPAFLQRCSDEDKATVIGSWGYQMVTDAWPQTDKRLADFARRGMPWTQMNKVALVNPNMIHDVRYQPGRHRAYPTGHVVWPRDGEGVHLLHYKYLGLDYLKSRLPELGARLKEGDLAANHGHKYRWNEQQIEDDFNHVRNNAITVP